MKKSLLVCVLAFACSFVSCKGSTNTDNIPDEEKVEMSPNEVVDVPQYKVVDNQIIPTDGKPMIVDFSASWCRPCKHLKPIFENLAEEFRDRITFVTIDVDEHPELSQAYNVKSVPMIVFLNKDGQIQNTIIGFQNKDQLLAAINTYYGF